MDLYIDLFESAIHVSGDKLDHLQEQFCLPYIQLSVKRTDIAEVTSVHFTVPKAVYRVKKCF